MDVPLITLLGIWFNENISSFLKIFNENPHLAKHFASEVNLCYVFYDSERGGVFSFFRKGVFHRWANRRERGSGAGLVLKIFKNLPWSPLMFFKKFPKFWSKTRGNQKKEPTPPLRYRVGPIFGLFAGLVRGEDFLPFWPCVVYLEY
jgi:hypothetical protein